MKTMVGVGTSGRRVRRVLLMLAAGLGIAATGCGNQVKATRDFQMTHPWGSFARIDVESNNGSIELRGGVGNEIAIRGVMQAGGRTLEEAEQRLDQIEVVAGPHASDPTVFHVRAKYPDTLRRWNVGVRYVIEVPEPCAAKIDTANGRVKLENLVDAVTVDTANGRVEAKQIAGTLDVRTSNGRIKVEDVSGDCDLETLNGRIEAVGIDADLRAETSNGRIRVTATCGPQNTLDVRTSNGSITLTIPIDMRAAIDLSTSNGRVSTSFDNAQVEIEKKSKRSLVARLNGGEGGMVKARSSNGSIAVDCQ